MKEYKIISLTIFILIMSCSGTKTIDRFELVELERIGYSISIDSRPVKLSWTYLNEANIAEIKTDKTSMTVDILRKDNGLSFYSVSGLRKKQNYTEIIDRISVDGIVLDSIMIQNVKFEDGAVKYIRLLTQKDYEGREFDDLPQVRESVGGGILIIRTR